MLENRSVPPNIVLPHVTYQNVAAAVDWLKAAFGFTEYYRYSDPEGIVQGAMVHMGEAWIMVNCSRPRAQKPGAGWMPNSKPDCVYRRCRATLRESEIRRGPHCRRAA